MVAALVVLFNFRARADDLLTLDMALHEARLANARLPLARRDVESAKARVREAQAELWPTLSAEGDLRYALPSSAFPNDGSEERLELFVRAPLYSGGALQERVAIAEANATDFLARCRAAEVDVDLEVRVRFAALVQAEAEVEIQKDAVDRLDKYLSNIRSRQLAGQGIEADLLKIEAELATQRVAVAAAELGLGEARYALNEVLGREPTAALAVAELPEPTAPSAAGEKSPWTVVPDLRGAAAQIQAADHGVSLARAERKPHLSFEVGGGYLGLADSRYPGDPFGQRVIRGFGLSLMLTYDWMLFDFGAYRARLALAQIDGQRARDNWIVTYRGARLAWDRARLQLSELFEELQIFAKAVPRSRDAFLAAESLYRGGAGTALAVLDAHRIWVQAAVAASRALLRYRAAEASYLRWGTP